MHIKKHSDNEKIYLMPRESPSPASSPPGPLPTGSDTTSGWYVLAKVRVQAQGAVIALDAMGTGHTLFLTLLCSLFISGGSSSQGPGASRCSLGCTAFQWLRACSDPIVAIWVVSNFFLS